MTAPIQQWLVRNRLGMFTFAPILLLIVLLLFFPPDGTQRSEWVQFAGGFHLLTIHFPIALILLVPVLEIGGRSRRFQHLRQSVEPILALAFFSALASAILGWLLARSGGYAGRLVLQHMWAGVFVIVICWLCWMFRARMGGRPFNIAYLCGLAFTVLLVSFTGYRGGQLSHGEAHLTEHMPSPLRDWLGLTREERQAATAATPDSFFTVRVEPVFQQNCVSCHGPSTQKRGLRLDSYEAVMRGGKSGPAVKAPDLNSGLLQRVSSPHDSEKIMPPQGKPPLSPDQIKLIELWISAGASPTLSVNSIKVAPAAARRTAEVTLTEIDEAAVARKRAPYVEALAAFEKSYPYAIEYESRDSANLILGTSRLGGKFGDGDLARLKPLYDQFVAVDLSNSAITDRSASSLAAMKHLRTLRLMHTRITDATVLSLGGLSELESLNLFGTGVTPVALRTAEHLPKLRHLYVGETRIPANRALALPDWLKNKVVF